MTRTHKTEQALVVFVTASSEEEAGLIGKRVVQEKLAACATIVAGVRSLFWWEGRVAEERETLIILKTKPSLFPELARAVKALHSYQVPEIIALSVKKGSSDYLDWIAAVTGKPKKKFKKSKNG